MIFMLPVSAFYACKTHSYAASPEYTSAAKRAAGICPAALVTNRLLLRRNALLRNGSRRKRLWFPLTHYGQFAVGTHLQADRGKRLFAVQHQGDDLILHFLFQHTPEFSGSIGIGACLSAQIGANLFCVMERQIFRLQNVLHNFY